VLAGLLVIWQFRIDRLKAALRERQELCDGWQKECERVEELESELKSLNEDSIPTIERLTAALNAANNERDLALALAAKEKKRADEQFAVIEDFDLEKRQIWDIYRDSTLGAGNCQDLLFSELNRLLRIHNAMAKKYGFEPNGIRKPVQQAIDRFSCQHRDEQAVKARIAANLAKPGAEQGSSSH
jgi:hypothetical protein